MERDCRRSEGSFNFEIRSVPIPEPKPWEVLIKLTVTGVCGTDVSLAAGYVGPTCDILGHEGVGHIVALGSGVDPSIVKAGDRIGVSWVRDACGSCPCCREPGGETRCLEQLNSGRKLDGTFAEYCVVPARYLLTLPDDKANLPDELVAPVLCGGVTAYKALKTCGATPGEWVAVVGAGGGEEFCLLSGAEAYFDALEPDVVASVKNTTTGGVGVRASIVTAGSGKAYQNGLDVLGSLARWFAWGYRPLPRSSVSILWPSSTEASGSWEPWWGRVRRRLRH
ncbi:unnamed protein product [Parascedosporium putredinis]|uniref:Alcohol dehydrogenase-like N-terminal domain-containing protein n=1 Tax=Parascedosporium putredinis TaxID=1442378 RepID=A0A9P1GZ28_9PEZI|nr:unnamed protein product [Parascedosporium putredinis]CAI7992424.1 unnamed protein product [Parascedosporium putredinis]